MLNKNFEKTRLKYLLKWVKQLNLAYSIMMSPKKMNPWEGKFTRKSQKLYKFLIY